MNRSDRTPLASTAGWLWLLALLLALVAGCESGSDSQDSYVPELPPVVEPPPEQPVPADTGLPGSWEPTSGLEPTGRLFVVEGDGDEGSSPEDGLVIVPGRWGVQKELRDLARQLATKNLVVAIPDLYDGVVPQMAVAVSEIQKGLDRERARALVQAAMERCASTEGVADSPDVFVMGVGAGGALAFQHALRTPSPLAGVVLDSPTALPEPGDDPPTIDAPVMILYGTQDASFDADRMARLKGRLKEYGIDARLEGISGAGSELFDSKSMGYSRAAMKSAMERLLELIASAS
jgi:dienelactone hydrolase